LTSSPKKTSLSGPAEIDDGVDIEFVGSAAEVGGEAAGDADAIDEESIVTPPLSLALMETTPS
jgi:hypothetical protein